MSKFDIQDQEVIAMCNARRIREQQNMIIDTDYVDVDEYVDAGIRVQVIRKAAGVVGRFMIGCMFLGAISRGWIDTSFGLAITTACFIWAWVFARRQS